MSARDLAVVLPRELASTVTAGIDDGDLAKRWTKAREDARAANPAATVEELLLFALADVLSWHGRMAGRIAYVHAEKIEGERKVLEGRAAGIDEALAVLSAEDAAETPSA